MSFEAALIDSLTDDVEAICDDVRLLASMRPSMQWNKMRGNSSVDLAEQRIQPRTLAYLAIAVCTTRKPQDRHRPHGSVIRLTARVISFDSYDDGANTLPICFSGIRRKWKPDNEVAPFTAYDFFFFDCATQQTSGPALKPWWRSPSRCL